MKLVPMKMLLNEAKLQNKAVAAINVSNMETIMALLEIAEIEESPVIIQVAPIQLTTQHISYDEIVALVDVLGKNCHVIASLHLDHATSVEDCYKAIDAGFTSVMYDGSMETYKNNIENTKKVIEYAKLRDVTVEAELGKVGGTEGEAGNHDNSYMTDPFQVKEFVAATDVDCLAVAIGNAHGLYKSTPKLDFERLKEIENETGIPLVLHGGTGIPQEDIDKAISVGIRKINFFTEIDRAFMHGFIEAYDKDQQVYMMTAQESGRQTMMKEMAKKIAICQRRTKA